MHAGHLLSVKDAMTLGVPEVEINNDENLATLCDECNLGLGSETVPLRLVARILVARLKRSKAKTA